MKKIVLIVSTSFPYGQAYSSRSRHFVKLFSDIGYHVHVIAPRSNYDCVCNELCGYDYSCEYVNAKTDLFSLCGIGTAAPYISALNNYINANEIDFVVSSSMVHVSDKILKVCRKNDIPYYIEQCEWFDKSTFKYGCFNPYYREHIRSIKKKNKKCSGIIAISQLFEQYYNLQNVRTIRIPTILDCKVVQYRTERLHRGAINLVFAGSLGKGKEQIGPILHALNNDRIKRLPINFDIYGPTREQVIENIGGRDDLLLALKDKVFIHGRIAQDKVEDVIRNADYSIFLRPNRKSSNAGFPTKLAESMIVGTPVITNETGDIGIYLQNGLNGYIVSEPCVQSLIRVFEKIVDLSPDTYSDLRLNARKSAESFFDYRNYIDKMKSFINAL